MSFDATDRLINVTTASCPNPSHPLTARRCLRLRADLLATPVETSGATTWIVKDPLTLEHFQFSAEEYALMDWLREPVRSPNCSGVSSQVLAANDLAAGDVGFSEPAARVRAGRSATRAGQGQELLARRDARPFAAGRFPGRAYSAFAFAARSGSHFSRPFTTSFAGCFRRLRCWPRSPSCCMRCRSSSGTSTSSAIGLPEVSRAGRFAKLAVAAAGDRRGEGAARAWATRWPANILAAKSTSWASCCWCLRRACIAM